MPQISERQGMNGKEGVLMAQVMKYYCDFCGKEIPKVGDRRKVSGAIELCRGGYEVYQMIIDINDLLLYPGCYEDLISEISPLVDYIYTHDKRNNDAETKEAAHE